MVNIYVHELKFTVTSLEIFQCLKEYPNFFFLDSALSGNLYSKYSFLGIEPFLVMKFEKSKILIQDSAGITEKEDNPFVMLERLLNTYKIDDIEDLKRRYKFPFAGGAVGYISYDMCRFIENVPNTGKSDSGFPEMYFGFYDTFVVFDHLENKCYIVSINFSKNNIDGKAKDLIKIIQSYVLNPSRSMPGNSGFNQMDCRKSWHLDKGGDVFKLRKNVVCNFTKKEYIETVIRAKEYIKDGDIYQVNLSQRFQTKSCYSPFELYERLRVFNPAPYSAFIGFDKLYIASSSPERFLAVRNINNPRNGKNKIRVQVRPIKGTRPRCKDIAADTMMGNELLSSCKDDAELTMIIDLERNDIGRVCNYGSVKVMGKKVLESFSTVHHLVSTIEGDLDTKYSIIDVIKATFPGGSITGAPKIRAMEIIDELEPTKRSVYTGAIGYLGFDGNVDLSMAIRIFMINNDQIFFQFGGGIVADSDPISEYNETLYKAAGLLKAAVNA